MSLYIFFKSLLATSQSRNVISISNDDRAMLAHHNKHVRVYIKQKDSRRGYPEMIGTYQFCFIFMSTISTYEAGLRNGLLGIKSQGLLRAKETNAAHY